jgi:thiamine-monophosphate kinase
MTDEALYIRMLRKLATHPAARGLTDDCAVLEVGEETLILTHDMMVEGVHFLPGQDPADVAWKLVAVNISDLAAKGAEPLGVLVGHMLGADDTGFIAGLEDALLHYGVPLLGGDTVSAGSPRVLGLTAIGRATHRPVPSRSCAMPGDTIYVTGGLGAAMLGYEALRDGAGKDSTAYRRPMARLPEGQALAPVVSAIMDISDGLLLDAWRMGQASDVTMSIDSGAVPIAAPEDRRMDALRWGDDYELLFTAPADAAIPVKATRIGTVLEKRDEPLLLDGALPQGRLGFEHS